MAIFEETNSINIPIRNKSLIYFLINNDDVVYVGQTKNGLYRPFSHRNKDFNRVEIIECKENELDLLEDYYILKYQPIYNIKINDGYKLITARNKLRIMCNNNITIRDIKKIVKLLNLKLLKVGKNYYVNNYCLGKIYQYIMENNYE